MLRWLAIVRESLDNLGEALCAARSRLPKSNEHTSESSLRTLKLGQIRADGRTQCRVSTDDIVVQEYASLMREGIEFPPVRVWFDGEVYWLSDGFQRLAAARLVGRVDILAEVFLGSLTDAQWDGCGANVTHGLRRTPSDVANAIRRSLAHPKSKRLSNTQIAKHVGVSEHTIRRWRNRLSSSSDEDSNLRIASRGGKAFEMNVAAIGQATRRASSSGKKSKAQLRLELQKMRDESSSPQIVAVLNIMDHWVFGSSTTADVLRALKHIYDRNNKTFI